MTRADTCLVAGILLVAIVAASLMYFRPWGASHKAASSRAVVTVRGRDVSTLELSDRRKQEAVVLASRIGPVTVEVSGTRIRMLAAPCPDRICMKQGWIDRPGQSVVCVPGEILIRIEGAAPVDAVTR